MKVDVVINSLGKPYQLLLTILSLKKHSQKHINKIFCIIDDPISRYNSFFKKRQIKKKASTFPLFDEVILKKIIIFLNISFSNIIFYFPKYYSFKNFFEKDMFKDEQYRHSIRYQYAWEKSQTEYLYISHNDCQIEEDIIGILLKEIEDNIGIGEIGQCWNCPAFLAKQCFSKNYLNYKPTYQEVIELYKKFGAPRYYPRNNEILEHIKNRPWPLPECRINEWGALINLEKAKRITKPLGVSWPFGAYYYLNKPHLDIAVKWFSDVSNLGYIFKHKDILNKYILHKEGNSSLTVSDNYLINEIQALSKLKIDFNRELDLVHNFRFSRFFEKL